MRKSYIMSLGALILVVLVIVSFLGAGISDLFKLNAQGPLGGAGPLTTPNVFVDPASVINDYSVQPVGSTFTLNVNVSSVTDLYTCQINLTWNHAVLNISRITAGEFLLRTASSSKTASYQLGSVMNQTSNVNGYSGMSDSILGSVSGISGSGRLLSILFKVVGYGACNITVSSNGNLKTTLLDSTGATIAYTSTNGYFRNALTGDANIDKSVNIFDITAVKSRWGTTSTSPNWIREYDVNNDNAINIFDITTIKANWGRTAP
jgi:hypothetical protein